jgi:hypothetical protein
LPFDVAIVQADNGNNETTRHIENRIQLFNLGDNMQDIEKNYRGYVYILGRDDYADDPTKPFNSWVYKDGELLDGGGDFEKLEEAEDMAKSTIDGYMEGVK